MDKFKVGDRVICWGWSDPASVIGTVVHISIEGVVVKYDRPVSPMGCEERTEDRWDSDYVKKLTPLEEAL